MSVLWLSASAERERSEKDNIYFHLMTTINILHSKLHCVFKSGQPYIIFIYNVAGVVVYHCVRIETGHLALKGTRKQTNAQCSKCF